MNSAPYFVYNINCIINPSLARLDVSTVTIFLPLVIILPQKHPLPQIHLHTDPDPRPECAKTPAIPCNMC